MCDAEAGQGEAMLLEGRVRACPGLLGGHRLSMSLKPLEYKSLWYWNKELLAKSSGVSM